MCCVVVLGRTYTGQYRQMRVLFSQLAIPHFFTAPLRWFTGNAKFDGISLAVVLNYVDGAFLSGDGVYAPDGTY